MTQTLATESRRVGGVWIAGFSAGWLGIWMAQLVPVQLLLPAQVERLVQTQSWTDSVVMFGAVSGVSAVCAIVAYPLAGTLSDRTRSRFGRRRPWIALGACVFALSLVVLSWQTTVIGVALWWAIATVGFCAMSSAATALIADQVPIAQRGFVAGWISAPQSVGLIVGLVLVTTVVTTSVGGYAALAVLLVVLTVPMLMLPDAQTAAAPQPLTLRSTIRGFWISPREHPDFGIVLFSRICTNIGNALGTGLLLYFLMFGLTRTDAETDLLVLTVIYMAASVGASLVCGRLSDRLQRRKIFVMGSALLQGMGALLLVAVPGFSVALVAAVLLGLGYGTFLSVDQALATQVLPDALSNGKDLGIMNIAWAVPQALAPMVGAFLVVASGSFAPVFLASAVCSIIGAWSVQRVRSVR